ncbi:hydroxyacid-oxoacid transhydrogenase [Amycolatopsis suaedae]|uniref:hydroxyacid-oxoacid transhydrogenase n=1 Tax=Amycolatopsis suaedae TaxID=2510978 RepID=A0A4Q7J9V3_9PSEU|nr:hydroxyacid-oxoacid transhydrogenase [Amycolatopsis suaedae]RZQ62934.1 iron-containing alcohol dehydrogenase [Amycolatopsis suaedae]
MTEYLNETVFTWGGVPLKFGAGAVDEIGHDLGQLGADRVLVVTDPGIAEAGIAQRVADAATAAGLTVGIYDRVHVEPTDTSFAEAVEFAGQSEWDGFIGVGGGSSIDTAKAINLLTTYPGELHDYLNKPIGEGKAPPGPLKPLVAVPTTAGTGAESTPVCVLDMLSLKVKTGISHPRLRPSLAVVDPLLTLGLPPEVTAASGMDVLCHALESYTAKPYDAFPRHTPETRVAYCGSNPISDLWAEKAMSLLGGAFRRAVLTGGDLAARTDMMMAATFAGMGFGNAGVHIPHACGYPIAGMVRDYVPSGYPDAPLVPHGQSVSLTAPAAFRFTFPTDPARHQRAARLLAPDTTPHDDPREQLPSVLAALMRDIGIPSGLGEVGYGKSDIDGLVDGAMKQQRLLAVAPRPVGADDLAAIFLDSFENW